MLTTEQLLEAIGSVLRRVYGQRLRGIVLYGSVAREEASADSDVDLLVLLDSVPRYGPEVRTCIDELYALSEEIGRRISPKPVPYADYERGACPLYRVARREGVAA